MSEVIHRRTFLKQAVAGTVGLSLGGALVGADEALGLGKTSTPGDIPKRTLGKTGERVTMIGLGGWHVGRIKEEAVALRTIHRALDLGITFFDTAFSYQDGVSEERLGKGLGGKRDTIFLMTKDAKRKKADALAHLHESLRRLRTDHVDLWQFHSIQTVEDVETLFGPDGAMEAAEQAKREGKIRYVGITGHYDPYVHLKALDYHEVLDTMQMPINPVDLHDLSFTRLVLPKLVEYNLGVLAMKTLAMGNIVTHGAATVEECLRYAWSLPISVLVSGCDSPEHVTLNVAAAQSFQPMTDAERETLVARVEPYKGPEVEYYKKKR